MPPNESVTVPSIKELETMQTPPKEYKLENIKEEKTTGYDSFFGRFQQRLNYTNIFFISLLHVISLYAVITYPYKQRWPTALLATCTGYISGVSITAGIHRYYTHRSFKATLPLQLIFLVGYAFAGHNKIYDWVRDHRVHHKFSETDADPHNSRRGFFFAHVGWLFMKKNPAVARKGKLVDMSDIESDPLVMWYDRHFILLKIIFCFTLSTILPMVLWDETLYYAIQATIVRLIILLNCTWLVNSAAHLYGTKPYDKTIHPKENFFVSIFCIGEGWHNYHHTFPWDYRASEIGKLNATTFWLHCFEKIGWCYDMKYPSDELIRKVSSKLGDGSHKLHVHIEEPSKENAFDVKLKSI